MIKIVFLIRSLDFGGSQTQLVTLVKALDPTEFEVTVICFYSEGTLATTLVESGIRVLSLEKRGRWDLGRFYGRLSGYLHQIQPQILHSYLSDPNLLVILLKPWFPRIAIVWGIRTAQDNLRQYSWFIRLLFWLECRLAGFADLIIANSQAGRAFHIAQGFPAAKTITIPNGIDCDLFQPDPQGRVKLRTLWGIPDSVILIGLVGRLDPLKDHPTFLKAAALLCQQRRDVHFVCIGSGLDTADQLQQLATDLEIADRITWSAARTDVPEVQNALDIATSCSTSEGFSNVITEAMACGVPCVVTDVGDSAWIVGKTGIVVPPADPQALAAGWQACLAMDRQHLGQLARARIIQHLSVQQLAMTTQDALVSLLQRQTLRF
ncbi:group 1 glycosyl transferase [Neosynechococcus sphagnicola sy1]|uniref:Group 1 glycosyl transferase n=1 Tax=Neosynechococcus sphagnicola sy1 TaxID=1497020 RepID=A0A098TIH7_9CYAN|nr:glycosyltransferase [Neosynechococcus sphagnicola]KGF72370.1 group 1 glycosyl transferase [Neosynechococcus sphagnicola sy1]